MQLQIQLLQEELNNTENKISFSRQFYNDAVTIYNTKIETVPSNIIAGLFNFKAEDLFEVEDIGGRIDKKNIVDFIALFNLNSRNYFHNFDRVFLMIILFICISRNSVFPAPLPFIHFAGNRKFIAFQYARLIFSSVSVIKKTSSPITMNYQL